MASGRPKSSVLPLVGDILYRVPGPFNPWVSTQGFLLTPTSSTQAYLVDPMSPPSDKIEKEVRATLQDRRLSHLFLTHSHIVQASGYAEWQKRFPEVQVVAPRGEIGENLGSQLLEAKVYADWKDVIEADGKDSAPHRFSALHIPGHRANHLAYLFRDAAGNSFLFGGDTLEPAGQRFCEDSLPKQVDSIVQLRTGLGDDAKSVPNAVCSTHGDVAVFEEGKGGSRREWFRGTMLGYLMQFDNYSEKEDKGVEL